jgi:hypothetical protein
MRSALESAQRVSPRRDECCDGAGAMRVDVPGKITSDEHLRTWESR